VQILIVVTKFKVYNINNNNNRNNIVNNSKISDSENRNYNISDSENALRKASRAIVSAGEDHNFFQIVNSNPNSK